VNQNSLDKNEYNNFKKGDNEPPFLFIESEIGLFSNDVVFLQ